MSSSAGSQRRRRAQGSKAEKLQADLEDLDPGLARWADEFVFGEVWGRPGLDHESRMLVAIASLATQGRSAQLRNYLFGAVQDGICGTAIHEALVMLVVYAGFPTGIAALGDWRDVRAACERRGIPIASEAGSGEEAGREGGKQ
jgi:4-carboxymuconolactone decarboxylase